MQKLLWCEEKADELWAPNSPCRLCDRRQPQCAELKCRIAEQEREALESFDESMITEARDALWASRRYEPQHRPAEWSWPYRQLVAVAGSEEVEFKREKDHADRLARDAARRGGR